MIYNIKDIEFEPEIVISKNYRRDYLLSVKNKKVILEVGRSHVVDGIVDQAFINSIISKHQRFIYTRLSYKKPERDENHLHYLGKEYKLEIKEADFDNILIVIDTITVYTKSLDKNYIKRIIYRQYETELRNIVSMNIERIKNEMNIRFDISFYYKEVKTYFGECYPKRRYVILNLRLAKYDMNYILSVIYHELAHFYYSDHQSGFYKLLEGVFPNYTETQKELRKIKYSDLY